MPVKEYRFHDAVLDKEILLPAGQVQDFVIRKTDGMPTYHFAVVVDDAAMGVNHILRGQEHLLNTMNHIALQEALGYERPVYGHLPIIMNTDGSKMGKRDRDKKVRHETHLWMKKHTRTVGDLAAATGLDEAMLAAWLESDTRQLDGHDQSLVMGVIGLKNSDLPEVLVHDFRANGYFPEVLLNFLALLGWSPGGDKERMSVDEMVQLFKMEDIGKSNAKFNRDKLRAFSTEAAATMTPAQLLPRLRDYLALNPDSPLNHGDDAALSQVLTMNAGFHVLREVDEKSRFMFIEDSAVEYEQAAIDKVLLKNDRQGAVALADVATVLKSVEPWQADAMETAIKDYCTTKNLGLGKVAQPIRVALCGSMVSPPIFQSLELMGREHTLARIARCLEKIG
jgi:glutamyl/glutaminyl-tRNA synthetase